jgi:MYXO-CTERM domain-containing protein
VYLVSLGLKTEDGDDLPWRQVVTVGAAVLFAAATAWLARRRHIERVSTSPGTLLMTRISQ